MQDRLCFLLDGVRAESAKHQIIEELVPCIKDRSEEQTNDSMNGIFAAAGYGDHRMPTDMEKKGLVQSIKRLRGADAPTWTAVLSTRGINLEYDVCQGLIACSPYVDKLFIVVEDNAGNRRVRYTHLPRNLGEQVDGLGTRNSSFVLDLGYGDDLAPIVLLDQYRKAQPARAA